jgi:hypothetical protein
MKLSILAGSTSQTVNVFIQDSSSTTGAGLTGLVYNTASLTAYYALPRAAAVAITLATQTVTGAYSSGGFVEISSTNMPGWYRLDIPDAAIASGRFTSIHLKGATNMAPLPIEIELTAWNNQDAVHGGMSALPNTACTTNASLITSGTGTDQLSVTSGLIKVSSGTGTGQLDFTSGIVKANVTQLLGTAWLTPGVAGTPDVNAKQFGGQTVTAAAGVTMPATVDSTTNITAGTITTATSVTNPVTISSGTGSGQISITSGRVKVQSNTVTNTALANFEFVMVDTSGVPKTGLTVTAQRSIDGGAFASCSNSVTELSNGVYVISLSAADVNGNVITLRFTATGAQDRLITVVMVP